MMMDHLKRYIFLAFLAASFRLFAESPVDKVNPLMGTESTYAFSYGNTYPAVAVPWGMNFWSPQTGANRDGWMYSYAQKFICGFRQTHQPSPWINDYGTFSIMPQIDSLVFQDKLRGASFSHQNETAKPYYYKVKFDNGITTEIAPTERAASLRIIFPKKQEQYILIDGYDGGSSLSIDPSGRRITGYVKNNSGGVPSNFANYIVLEFDKPIEDYGLFYGGKRYPKALNSTHDHVYAYLKFNIGQKPLEIKTASSFISLEQAQLNLKREIGIASFDDVSSKAKQEWNKQLSRIEVDGGTLEQEATFYSCLYRTLLFPRKFYELNGKGKPLHYSPYDGKIHDGYMYTDNGFWDTFRAVHPLFTLVYPSVSAEVTASIVNAYKEGGWLPEWSSPGYRDCMVGNNSISILTDAWVKGIRSFDAKTALEAMIHQANNQGPINSVGRNGYEAYNRLGYVPYPEFSEATAKTLEYAYADWCIFRFAEAIGDKAIAKKYRKQAFNYKNLLNPSTGFMGSKNGEGKWREPFDATEWGGPFTEGSSWHYTWSVMHDPEGLSQLLGGHEHTAYMLDSMFRAPNTFKVGTYGFVIHEMAEMAAINMGQYAHGNQPVQHAIYLFDYLGKPWRAQFHLRNVMDKLYHANTKGYCGDEDNGQTSAWYVFSALGFYPVCPGTTEYALGSPLFKKATITFETGKKFIIDAANNSKENIYIQDAFLNQKSYSKNYLTFDNIRKGGTLKLKMSQIPNAKRGILSKNSPYSLTKFNE
jgi:predicted alpha-1,2-mannosidase